MWCAGGCRGGAFAGRCCGGVVNATTNTAPSRTSARSSPGERGGFSIGTLTDLQPDRRVAAQAGRVGRPVDPTSDQPSQLLSTADQRLPTFNLNGDWAGATIEAADGRDPTSSRRCADGPRHLPSFGAEASAYWELLPSESNVGARDHRGGGERSVHALSSSPGARRAVVRLVNGPASETFLDRNLRATCICGARRLEIDRLIIEVTDKLDDPILPRFYYRCPSCRTYSAPNIYFPVDKYVSVPVEAMSIPQVKADLNRDRVELLRRLGAWSDRDAVVVYDLGSGEGAFSRAFQAGVPNGRAIACEADDRLKEKFYGDLDRVVFVPMYIEDFLDQQIVERRWPAPDLVVLTDVLEHVVDPEELLGQVRRVMAPGALGYFVVPNAATLGDGHAVNRDDVDWPHANRTCQHLWMYDHDAFVTMIGEKFEIVATNQTFETERRRDSVYTTVVARRGG
jgi:SAM-dependent methyltransferase